MAIMTGCPDVVRGALADGIDLGLAHLGSDDWDASEERRMSYLAMESEVLLYHTAECLLRLILAHAPLDSRSSPPLTLAGLRRPGDLYDAIRDTIVDLDDDQLNEVIARTIYGFRPWDGIPPELADEPCNATSEMFDEGLANLRDILRYLGEHVRGADFKAMNNAAKHGLAIRLGEHGFALGDVGPNGKRPIDQRGPALTCIDLARDPTGQGRLVEQVIVWSNPTRNIGFIFLMIDLIDAVWELGRALHTDHVGRTFRVFDKVGVDTVLVNSRKDGPSPENFYEIPHMRIPLGLGVM
jgi:hypothetical protein